MFVADAGNERREEIDFMPRGQPGLNFGWPCFEGTLPFDLTASCDSPVAPLLEYPRAVGACAVIGGVVARDARLPALAGRYLYGDFCSGKIAAISRRERARHRIRRARARRSGADQLRPGRARPGLCHVSPRRCFQARPEAGRLTTSAACSRAPSARSELRDPRCGAKPEPDRRQQHVEDDDAREQHRPPEGQTPGRHPPFLAQVASSAGRRSQRLSERPLAGRAVRVAHRCASRSAPLDEPDDAHGRLLDRQLGHVDHGQPSRRWSADASSSSQ